MSAKTVVRAFISENLPLAQVDLTDNVSLVGQGILDSVSVVELVAVIEDAFHINIDDGDLRPDNLGSLNAIQAFVERKLAHAAG